MPETAVHKYYRVMAWQHDVWCSRQLTTVQSEAQSKHMKHLANNNFRLGIATAYRGHIATSLLWRDLIHSPCLRLLA